MPELLRLSKANCGREYRARRSQSRRISFGDHDQRDDRLKDDERSSSNLMIRLARRNQFIDLLGFLRTGSAQIVIGLQIEPELLGGAEITS